MTARRLAALEFDCDAWAKLEPSASRADAGRGVLDRYSVDLEPASGLTREAVLARAIDALQRYRIFPPERMRAAVCTPDRRIAPGATIVQRLFIGSMGLETAVRVVDQFDVETGAARRVGFTYATLRGHPERGIATFAVNRHAPSGALTFTIESWSRSGHWLTLAGRPLSRWMQKVFTREALAHFRSSVTAPSPPEEWRATG